MNRIPVVAVLSVAVASACIAPVFVPGEPAPGPSDGPSWPSPRTPPPRSLSDVELRRAILAEVNDARRAHGVPGLAAEEHLAGAAIDYSEELARTRRLSHESDTPGRRTLAERLAAAGMVGWSRAGENLAMIPGPDTQLAQRVVGVWLDSPGHRRNLLEPDYTLSGVGAARTDDGYWYVAQVYARPMALGR